MKKNGFTLIEMLGVVLIIGMLSSIAVLTYNKYLKKSKDELFEIEEKNFGSALDNAYIKYLSGEDNRLKTKFDNHVDGLEITVLLSELINYNYIDPIKNPNNKSELCNSNSYIKMKSNKKTICLICGSYSSSEC